MCIENILPGVPKNLCQRFSQEFRDSFRNSTRDFSKDLTLHSFDNFTRCSTHCLPLLTGILPQLPPGIHPGFFQECLYSRILQKILRVIYFILFGFWSSQLHPISTFSPFHHNTHIFRTFNVRKKAVKSKISSKCFSSACGRPLEAAQRNENQRRTNSLKRQFCSFAVSYFFFFYINSRPEAHMFAIVVVTHPGGFSLTRKGGKLKYELYLF